MKKGFLLTILAVLAAATVANAAPRFGAVAMTSGNNGANIGAIVSDDMYNASLLLGNTSTDATGDPSSLEIQLNVNYKVALDSATAGTVGITYGMTTGDISGTVEHDGTNTISLNAGIERALSSNLLLIADVAVYSQTTVKPKGGAELKISGIFNNGRVGIAYLF